MAIAQKPQRRVQTSPRIRKVAVPAPVRRPEEDVKKPAPEAKAKEPQR